MKFTNLSINALNFLWDFGDGCTSNSENPFHKYTTSGTYLISLIVFNGICADTAISNITVINSSGIINNNIVNKFDVYPNPVINQTNIVFSLNISTNLTIDLINNIGVKINEIYDGNVNPNKQYNIEFNNHNIPAGVYYIIFKTNYFVEIKKIVII